MDEDAQDGEKKRDGKEMGLVEADQGSLSLSLDRGGRAPGPPLRAEQ